MVSELLRQKNPIKNDTAVDIDSDTDVDSDVDLGPK